MILLILMIFASFAEMISIGSVLPFLGVLISPDLIFSNNFAQPLIKLLGFKSSSEILLPVTIIFACTSLAAGFMRLTLLWANTRLAFAAGADLSIEIYRRTLYQPYITHCSRNSSEVINGISGKTNTVIYSTILPALTLISSLVILSAILFVLLIINPIIALTSFCGFGLIYLIIVASTRKQLLEDSQHIARESNYVIKSLQEGLGGIRDVLIDGNQATFCSLYRNADLRLRRAQGNNFFISQSPRYGMEALGMCLIAFLAYFLASNPKGLSQAIPMLGALALGAQRLLPVVQQSYASWSSILGGHASLDDTLKLLDQPLPSYFQEQKTQLLSFNQEININQLSFRYKDDLPYVLKNLNLRIKKGDRIGIIGKTGSGKSTLLDIVMALLEPTNGSIDIDGRPIVLANQRSWQAHIAHVPQSIFLSDCSIEENIAFGIPKSEINRERVRSAAKQAQIIDIIESWPNKYNTFIGERGVRLSGGQRQRIGIARALYKQADIIVFDEATSALDSETESAVMHAIENLSKDITILIIAHRLSTLKNCTKVVELSKGSIKKVGSYQEMMSFN